MSGSTSIDIARSGAVLQVRLNRPEKRNAISLEMRDTLLDALELLALDETLGAMVLYGAGAGFCAGADLSEFTSHPIISRTKESRRLRDLFGAMASSSAILVAVMHGFAIGSGLELALLCDLRFATAATRVGLPELTLGMMPPAGGTATLPRVAGLGTAVWLTGVARPVDVQDVQVRRLVNGMVDDVGSAVEAWTAILNRHPAAMLRQLKRSVRLHELSA